MATVPKVKEAKKKRRPAAVEIDDATRAEYAKLVATASLAEVTLIAVNARIHSERLRGSPDELQVRSPAPQYMVMRDVAAGVVRCGTRFRAIVETPRAEPKDEDALIEITAEYFLTYEIPNLADVSDQIVRIFGRRNGVFNAWPFFRELAHSLVSKMSLPPMMLPLLKLPPLATVDRPRP